MKDPIEQQIKLLAMLEQSQHREGIIREQLAAMDAERWRWKMVWAEEVDRRVAAIQNAKKSWVEWLDEECEFSAKHGHIALPGGTHGTCKGCRDSLRKPVSEGNSL